MHNGKKYAMFEGHYNYTQAAAKCTQESGILALAVDQKTFNVMYNMFMSYWWPGGEINGAYLDGTYQSNTWFSVNTPDRRLPADVPWHPGRPDYYEDEKCVSIMSQLNQGLDDTLCPGKRMAMCQLPV